jgi:seryl-tRNA synthetase
LFYFKATETSNAFYDNTYKFSQDIAGLLVRIESGFGERLKHLDDSYTSMRDQLQRYPDTSGVAGAKQEIKEEQQQLQEKVKERDQMIQELLARTQMQESERSDFLSRLKEREKELETARQEMQLLQRRLRSISRPDIVPEGLDLTPSMRRYIQNTVIERIGKEYVMEAPPPLVRRRFLKYASLFHPQFINDMKKRELMTEENELTIKGFQVLRSIANGSLCNGETT